MFLLGILVRRSCHEHVLASHAECRSVTQQSRLTKRSLGSAIRSPCLPHRDPRYSLAQLECVNLGTIKR